LFGLGINSTGVTGHNCHQTRELFIGSFFSALAFGSSSHNVLQVTAARSCGYGRAWQSAPNASALDRLTFDDAGPFGIGVKAHCSQMQKIQ
tara:strand:+ start:516 stop:788 length:273 start_codon:yes stop_codon:yes gene_type:complete